MTFNIKDTMIYNFTKEEKEILEKASEILDIWEENIGHKYISGQEYIKNLIGDHAYPSCIIEEILETENFEIDMGEYV